MKQVNTLHSPKPNFSLYLRSAVFYLSIVLTTVFICPIMILAWPLPFSIRNRLALWWVGVNLWTLKTVCSLTYEVRGLENIPERNGVILSKHQSTWETFAVQQFFPPMVFILKKELLRIPIWGWAMATQDPIAIDRSAKTAALKQVLRDGEARLKQGRWVLIFPEGTRVAPGAKGRYNTSGAVLAHRSGCPVVPVAHNAGEFWGKNKFIKYPGVIQVRVGPALDSTRFTAAEISSYVENWIETQMAEISSTAVAGQA
jgi:1-acyl-sn-glycerol-3-phosphate acyltransferase